MNHAKRVQRDLDAANAAEALFQTQHAEDAASAVQSVELEALTETPAPIPPVVVAPAAPPAAPAENFEHKYRVLQGMYEADVKVVKATQRELDSRLRAIEEAPSVAPASPTDNSKDIETFGADLIEMVKRYAEGQQEATNARLDALERKVGVVSQRTEINAEQGFFDKLAATVPDAEAINANPDWLVWLGTRDAFTGKPYQEALNDARSKLDVTRVTAIFNAFKATQVPVASAPASGLEDQINPQGVGTPPPMPPKAPVFLSEKSILDFYNDVGRGRYAGKDDEMNAREAVINLAVAEGRVRG